ncbi:hypothetical protein SBV1_150012 [Verrucomicrobia bacterium]|nr:hypothetical protein SBV1_150012 [Verrucomicrobiota bacterium]
MVRRVAAPWMKIRQSTVESPSSIPGLSNGSLAWRLLLSAHKDVLTPDSLKAPAHGCGSSGPQTPLFVPPATLPQGLGRARAPLNFVTRSTSNRHQNVNKIVNNLTT